MSNKYGARAIVTADGLRFDSQKEHARWNELLLLERGGRISDLERQCVYPLHDCTGRKLAEYRADFRYVEEGQVVVEDVKGAPLTAMYQLKKRWVRSEYGREIRET